MKLSYKIKENDKFYNILEVLKTQFKISERLLIKLKKNDKIFLNGKSSSVKEKVSLNDTVEVLINFEEDNSNIVPNSEIELKVVYEDEALLIVNKQPNCAIHPSILHYNDSLSNAVRYHFDQINLKRKIRPVNRLDRDTSGLVIFAKNEYVQECLVRQMKNNIFKKYYIAVVEGKFEEKEGVINLPIARKKDSIIERCISKEGVKAITHYKVIKYVQEKNISYVECLLETGRTHQIRVHLSAIGHPIIGDTLYGTASPFIDRQALHAYKISVIHPISGEKMEFNFNNDSCYLTL